MTALWISIVTACLTAQLPCDSLILRRGGGQMTETPELKVWYERESFTNSITIEAQQGKSCSARERRLGTVEFASFMITADAPLPIEAQTRGPLQLFAVGRLSGGATAIERWTIALPAETAPPSTRLAVTKERLPAPPGTGMVRACAIGPRGEVLIAQRDDTGDVLRIDLATGRSQTLFASAQFASLCPCNAIEWHRHAERGPAFLLIHVDRGCSQTGDRTMILWDRNEDGIPESCEEVLDEAWIDRGYNGENQWSPPTFPRFSPSRMHAPAPSR
jgi:hypothetical protein